jgi:hypothetical protein
MGGQILNTSSSEVDLVLSKVSVGHILENPHAIFFHSTSVDRVALTKLYVARVVVLCDEKRVS